jgi:hypothetical protein
VDEIPQKEGKTAIGDRDSRIAHHMQQNNISIPQKAKAVRYKTHSSFFALNDTYSTESSCIKGLILM